MGPRNNSQTQKISFITKEYKNLAQSTLEIVRDALVEKGYDPVIQIVGYIVSGDPTYITAHNNARSLITKVERDELLEEIVHFYLENRP